MSQHRGGDASIIINGETKTLRLTLGALAALEENLGEGDFSTLQTKLEAPRVADLLVILQALLQGGGTLLSLDALKAGDIDLSDAASAIAKAFSSLSPSPAGRGVRGEGPAVAAEDLHPQQRDPHPALRATFSQREKEE